MSYTNDYMVFSISCRFHYIDKNLWLKALLFSFNLKILSNKFDTRALTQLTTFIFRQAIRKLTILWILRFLSLLSCLENLNLYSRNSDPISQFIFFGLKLGFEWGVRCFNLNSNHQINRTGSQIMICIIIKTFGALIK